MDDIKEQLAQKLNQKYGEPLEIMAFKFLGHNRYGVKFRMTTRDYQRSDVVQL
jgi:hypothetical protein